MKNASLLFLDPNVSGVMDDIPYEKYQKIMEIRKSQIKYYRDNVSKYVFPWCIAAYPNKRWAETVFPNDEKAFDKLFMYVMKMCMVDKDNPLQVWKNYIDENNYYKNELNNLEISSLHYTNNIGTDLNITIPYGNKWMNLDKCSSYNNSIIVNMPSYEIFTSPDCRKTNGVVYSSKPLIFNGRTINDFSFEFKEEKIINCKAVNGGEILKSIIKDNENMDRLGEVALVLYDYLYLTLR